MTTPTRDTIARLIRSAPDTHTVEGSEELADRILQLTEGPELREIRPPLRPVRSDPVSVQPALKRLRALERQHRMGDDEPSRRRRIILGVLEIVEDEVPMAGRALDALRALRDEWRDR